jgi:hypothetical protein
MDPGAIVDNLQLIEPHAAQDVWKFKLKNDVTGNLKLRKRWL